MEMTEIIKKAGVPSRKTMADKMNLKGVEINAMVLPNIGANKKLTPEEFKQAAIEWQIMIRNHMVTVETGRNNTKTGEMIMAEKPEPPLIESFLNYIGISWDAWVRYMGAEGYEEYHEVARALKEFCTMQIIRYVALGLLSEKIAIFYLVNNSRYVDKSEVVQTTTIQNRPSWLNKDTGKLQDEQKFIPDQDAEFEEL